MMALPRQLSECGWRVFNYTAVESSHVLTLLNANCRPSLATQYYLLADIVRVLTAPEYTVLTYALGQRGFYVVLLESEPPSPPLPTYAGDH